MADKVRLGTGIDLSRWVAPERASGGRPQKVALCDGYENPPMPCTKATEKDGDVDTARLVKELERTRIADLKGTIQKLEADIPVLRAQLEQKVVAAVALENSAREQAAAARKKNRRNNLLLAFAGVPASAMAVKIVIDGEKHDSLDSAIRAASEKIERARRNVRRFDRSVEAAREDIAELKEAQAELETALETADDLPNDSRTVRLCETSRCLQRRQQLAQNLRQQLAILTVLKGRGLTIGNDLDDLIEELEGLVERADRLLSAAEKEYFDIIEGLLGRDPERALTKLVSGRIRSYVKKSLVDRGLSKPFVDHLLKRARVDDAATRRAALTTLDA